MTHLPITDRLRRVSLIELIARPMSKRAAGILFLTSLYINTTIFVLAERHNAAVERSPEFHIFRRLADGRSAPTAC
jgi:hypothetical protein